MIKTDYSDSRALFLCYPENFESPYHELAPFFEGLIFLCPPEITCFVVVNNVNSARYIKKIFKNKDVRPILVKGFQEVWLRDMMGFAFSDHIVRPQFKPDYCTDIYDRYYLKQIDKQINYIIRKSINVPIKRIPLIWDGGNFGTNGTVCFITDKILRKNHKSVVVNTIENTLRIRPIFLPTNKFDVLGHTDSLLTFIDSQTILSLKYNMQYSSRYDQQHIESIHKIIRKENYKLVYVRDFIDDETNNGIESSRGSYVNHLRLNKTLIVPTYNAADNENFLNERVYSSLHENTYHINCDKIGCHGGGLHCISFCF